MANGTLNKVILIGNVGSDPVVKRTDSGTVLANFSIATTDTRKGKDPLTEWHRILVFNKLAEIVEKWVKKGHKVYVEGRIQYRKWTDKDGSEKMTTEIVVDQLQMLSGKDKVDGQDNAVQQTELKNENDFFDDAIPF